MAKLHPLLRAKVPIDKARADAHEKWLKSVNYFFYSEKLTADELTQQLADQFPALRGIASNHTGLYVVEAETFTLFGWLLTGPAGVVVVFNVLLNDDLYSRIDSDDLKTRVGRLTHENRYGEIHKEWFALNRDQGSKRLRKIVTTGTIVPPTDFGPLKQEGDPLPPPPPPAPDLGGPPPPSTADAVDGPLPGLLDAQVEVDEDRENVHRLWSAGVSFAVFGPVDPFDLVAWVRDRFPEMRGRVEGDLFLVDEPTFQIGANMLTAEHGSAALFTVRPGGQVDMARFSRVFDFPNSIDDKSNQCKVDLVNKGFTDNRQLIDIVINGDLAPAEVFRGIAL